MWVNLELKSHKLITSIDMIGAFEESWMRTDVHPYSHAGTHMYTNPPCLRGYTTPRMLADPK